MKMDNSLFQDKYWRSAGQKKDGWKIAKSPIHGKGVFAKVEYNPGDDIDLCFIRKTWSPDVPLDEALVRTKFCSFINHFCPANSELYQKGVMYILKATKSINPDDEITADYNEGLAYEISGGFPLPKV